MTQDESTRDQQKKQQADAQQYFSKVKLSNDSVKGSSNLTDKMSGAEIYNRVGGWIHEVCEDSTDEEKVLPSIAHVSADQRATKLASAPAILDELASDKKHQGRAKAMNALAHDLAQIQWTKFSAFLAGESSPVTSVNHDNEQREAQKRLAEIDGQLEHSPNITKIEKMWIGVDLMGSAPRSSPHLLPIIEITNLTSAPKDAGSFTSLPIP